ncbi:complex I assembly factor TIMMDC1, mitochondrial isoform X4 [Nematostella vectensis]|uniref:complex I assembly factor TIMMDC1, mitochondrial isoform X4 n=1 Tax=Nematostella vectensis TaxID=45351 RepID=UPI0020779C06|nr:complex I assembly factor TIMMDC1, mitochondrial isoform X4 [Nematostella vectensis]XP_048584405.1 complex I assembly factor TIMMDC1, mitochondrial isoform X4 [Nematostella vectensis]XP_048584406.1 complex I assembly factor TIMMDC1, mitochondrial isoform X4 [Nematostella vectensis]XP_048584407.1 complex I assembly factor TIMMDC1, mitochondrial isoform X4 [Nematostella vectensis]
MDQPEKSGWDRVKALVQLDDNNQLAEEVQDIPTIICVGSIFGFLLGGQYGVRIRADSFLRQNKLTVYKSAMHAQRSFQSAKTLGFVRYGCRWGWRVGWFSGLYSFMLAATTSYRNKEDALNYVAAGASTGAIHELFGISASTGAIHELFGILASTGAIFKLFGGWRSMVVASGLCATISLPIGLLSQYGNTYLIPEEYRQKLQEKKEKEREEWRQKLQKTDVLIKGMEDDVNKETNKS